MTILQIFQIVEIFCWVIISVAYASQLEWALHKYIMHRPFLGFKYPFNAHAKTHHQIFKSDTSYHLHNDDDKHTIPMAWWNGIVLVTISTVPVYLLGLLVEIGWLWIVSMIVIALYYATYEYLHWCMHLPSDRWFENSQAFKFLNMHHRIHHKMMHKNLNVVLPFADLLWGTLVLDFPEEGSE